MPEPELETNAPSVDNTPLNPFLSGERIRVERHRIRPFQSRNGSMSFEHTTKTKINGPGQFETQTTVPSFFLPEGTRVTKPEEIALQCFKYDPKNPAKGCGPLTIERVYWCARCKRPFCESHSWHAIFAINRYCIRCLSIRAIELIFKCFGEVFKGIANAINWAWKSWWTLFEK